MSTATPPAFFPHPPPPATPPRRRLLLVDDHKATLQALAHLLTRRKYEVVTAASVTQALAVAAAVPIDLVLSDLTLPDGNGYDLMDELRRRYGVSGIALTGYDPDEHAGRAAAVGFTAHLTKPVNLPALDEALRQARWRTIA